MEKAQERNRKEALIADFEINPISFIATQLPLDDLEWLRNHYMVDKTQAKFLLRTLLSHYLNDVTFMDNETSIKWQDLEQHMKPDGIDPYAREAIQMLHSAAFGTRFKIFPSLKPALIPKEHLSIERLRQLEFGNIFAYNRQCCGLTQQTVADYLGVNQATEMKWENNQGRPDIFKLEDAIDLFIQCGLTRSRITEEEIDTLRHSYLSQWRIEWKKLVNTNTEPHIGQALTLMRKSIELGRPELVQFCPELENQATLLTHEKAASLQNDALQRHLDGFEQIRIALKDIASQRKTINPHRDIPGEIYDFIPQSISEETEKKVEDINVAAKGTKRLVSGSKEHRGKLASDKYPRIGASSQGDKMPDR
jgi:transcriptional regulator with XRE-family HTH domain